MPQPRWIMLPIAGAAVAWFAGSQFASKHTVYAATNAVAYTAEMVLRHYDQSGAEKPSATFTEAHRSDGSWVLLRMPGGVKSITDTTTATRTTVDPVTQSRTTYKLNAEEVERRRSPKASCDTDPTLKVVTAPGEKLLGFDVIHYSGVSPGSDHPVERWMVPALNCLRLKEVVINPPYTSILSVEKVTLGEPDKSLFDIPQSFVERRPSDILTLRNANPNPKTTEILDKAYDSRQK